MKKLFILAMVVMLAGLAAYGAPREQVAKPPTVEIKADVTYMAPAVFIVNDVLHADLVQIAIEPTQIEKIEIQAIGDVLCSKFRWRSQVYSINSGKKYTFKSPVKYAVSNQNLSRMPRDGLRSKTSQEA